MRRDLLTLPLQLIPVFMVIGMLVLLALVLVGAFAEEAPTEEEQPPIVIVVYQPTEDLEMRVQRLEEILEGLGLFEATAYSHECGTGDGYTATMTRPEEGRTIAVDPNVIPLGSVIWVEGWGWMIAEDAGGLIKGEIIDIFVECRQDALEWGRRDVLVYAESERFQ